MTKTTNWAAFDSRNSKCRSGKSDKRVIDGWEKNASQAQIDDNNDAIARYLAQRAKEKAQG